MASSSSLTPRTNEDGAWSYVASTSIALLFDDEVHPTIWDPTENREYPVTGRIACEMTLPNERFLSVSLYLDHCIPPDGTGTSRIRSLVKTTLFGPDGGLSPPAQSIVDEAKWTLELRYHKLDTIPRHPRNTPCHFILFQASIPVGSQFFTDKGSGSVTRSFRFYVQSVTEHPTPENPSGIRKEETTQESFTVTVLKTGRIMV